MKKYLIVLEKTKTGFSAYSPDIPGCAATGSTKKETEQNIYHAIQFHLEGMLQEGLRLPENTSESEMFVFLLLNQSFNTVKKIAILYLGEEVTDLYEL